jgi:beta-N-acetylhexosaminidase
VLKIKQLLRPLLLLCALLSLSPMRTIFAADAAQIEAQLAAMTTRQKAAQLVLASLWGPILTEEGRTFLQTYQVGGVIVFEYNVDTPQSVTALVNDWQQTTIDAGGPPLFIGVDQEGGRINTLEQGFTAFPAAQLIGAIDDIALVQAYGAAIATEVRAVGINMSFSPVADVETTIANPIIYRRAFGSYAPRVGQVVTAIAQGMQSIGVIAVAKHFPGHGDTTQDSHLTLPSVDQPRAVLESRELVPFATAINGALGGVMVAHVSYPSLDAQGTPASLSYPIVTELLREQMGFDGLIVTDAMDMDAIDNVYTSGEAAVLAVLAGVDLLALGPHMPLRDQIAAIEAIAVAVEDGRISTERLDASVRRILRAKAQFGILDWQPLDPDTAAARIPLVAHAALVEQLFAAGVTLVQNQPSLIPLRGPIAVIYNGARPQIKQTCALAGFEIDWVGVSASPSAEDRAAVQRLPNGITRVVFTDNAFGDTAQADLVNALPPQNTVVVALSTPYDWLRFPGVAGFIATYSPLPAAVPAACAVLFGETQARGSLSVNLSFR